MIYNTCINVLSLDNLSNYLSSDLLNELYFIPKKVDKKLINKILNNPEYVEKVNRTINLYKNLSLEKFISDKIANFELDTCQRIESYKLFLIIGLDTTTIYSFKYKGEDVSVLLLESIDGNMEKLDILLAHEFTHWVRKQSFQKDIFEKSLGERFIVEGIGCNYSREIVPDKKDCEYCLVNDSVVTWVKNNIDKVEEKMMGHLETNELMSDFFYMFADTRKTKMPARVGYVYGYLKVKDYLEKNNLRIRDIINIDWKEILTF